MNNNMNSSTDELLNDLMLQLHGNVEDDEIELICDQLRICLQQYTVNRVGTQVSVYEGLPREFEIYLVAKKIEGRSKDTLNLYRIRLQDMFQTINKRTQDITSNDIRLYLYNLQQTRNMSDRTLDGCRLIFNAFFKWCWQEGYIDKNPCASIRPIHYESKPRQPLNDIEMEILRRGCITPRDSAMIETLYSTGCRCSELCNLMKEDVNLETREVKLFGKGKKHRSSYLSARGVISIREYLDSRDDDSPYLFCSNRKPYSQLNNGAVEWAVTCIAVRSGVENVYPHRIRHTFATDALGRGMDVTDLQSLLGHSSVDTTLIYAKIDPQKVQTEHRKYIN